MSLQHLPCSCQVSRLAQGAEHLAEPRPWRLLPEGCMTMASNHGIEFGTGADSRPWPMRFATGHFWCQPFRLGLQADDGQADEFEQAGREPDADGQSVPTWCDEEN